MTSLADNRTYFEEQKGAPGPAGTLSFNLPDTKSWPPGDYRLVMQGLDAADALHGTFDFKLTAARR